MSIPVRPTEWQLLLEKLNTRFNAEMDEQGILFMIGVQELGKGHRRFNKDQKVEVMHVAICTLLEPYGYYTFLGRDEDGWPHWEASKKLPSLKPSQQKKVMEEAIINYFKEIDFFENG